MVTAFEIMPVLAMAMLIVLIPLLGDPPPVRARAKSRKRER
jgi:hypothetical protein